MRIQNLILPQNGVCNQNAMYFRLKKNAENTVRYLTTDGILLFEKHGQCSFDTYFNGFTQDKWKKYTTIRDVSLQLQLKGHFEVTLLDTTLSGGSLSVTAVNCFQVNSAEIDTFTFPYNLSASKGILSFSLKALEDNSIFAGGGYDTQISEDTLQKVKIAVNICTFKREPFILRNIDILRNSIFENTNSALYGNLRVYISDNGQTLPIEQLADENVRIVPNKNVGGAGGFSRGLIEILKHSETFPATHALMMDDDIVIEPESLFRTYMLLRCRKPEYRDVFVGGAMLKLDHPTIQVESGAYWNAGKLHSNKANLDMSTPHHCVLNEVEEYTEYNAWWYCCTPMTVVSNTNLPLPIFIRGDDVEYGLRNMKALVLLNGICVWHEAFENKYSSFLSYYILRNLLYNNTLHAEHFGLLDFLKILYRNIARELLYYRYKNADLLMKGVEDFLKGTDFLLTTDGEMLHKEIMAAGYQAQPLENAEQTYVSDWCTAQKTNQETKLHKLLRYVTANGYLLPAKATAGKNMQVVHMALCRPNDFFREKRILNYDPASKKGFVTEKNYGKTMQILARLAVLTMKIIFRYRGTKKAFRENVHELTNLQSWENYLGL